MGTNGWLPGTTTKGMPYDRLDPKSGCRNCLKVSMRATYALELGSTAACEISWLHALLAGKTAHPPMPGPLARPTTRAEVAGRGAGGAGGAGRRVGGLVAAALIGT